jgi:hypothetical protein
MTERDSEKQVESERLGEEIKEGNLSNTICRKSTKKD